jgi:hypothetical protein
MYVLVHTAVESVGSGRPAPWDAPGLALNMLHGLGAPVSAGAMSPRGRGK